MKKNFFVLMNSNGEISKGFQDSEPKRNQVLLCVDCVFSDNEEKITKIENTMVIRRSNHFNIREKVNELSSEALNKLFCFTGVKKEDYVDKKRAQYNRALVPAGATENW
ncbi:MAG: hypothetical protein PHH54_06250 [Candidatus Nanoarchaeia archaeon]|nr:hypothetical protein [Candidatus Nanoarchaeia archaeon]MDD5741556.1 hypothetical protein [Candidatus Nanoarchaeia archaeon]